MVELQSLSRLARVPTAISLISSIACGDVSPPEPFDHLPEEPPEPHVIAGEPPGYATAEVENGGTIRGRVRFRGGRPHHGIYPVPRRRDVCGSSQPFPAFRLDNAGGLADAVVYLDEVERGRAPTSLSIDDRGCQLAPHVAVATPGAELTLVSHDETLHAIEARYEDGSLLADLTLDRADRSVAVTFDREGVVELRCRAGHPWELAFVHVLPHPYAAVTTPHGTFEIANVPPGQYTLALAHAGWASESTSSGRPEFERPLRASQPITVLENQVVEVEFDLSVASAEPALESELTGG
jgi:plastocyanin